MCCFIKYVKLCRELRLPAPDCDCVCVITYVAISLTNTWDKSGNSCAFYETLRFLTIFSRVSVPSLHKTRIQRYQITHKRLFLEKNSNESCNYKLQNFCFEHVSRLSTFNEMEWKVLYDSTMRQNKETLEGDSSVWLCSETEKGDNEARQFSVAVQ